MNHQINQNLAEIVFYCIKGEIVIRREIIKGNEHMFYCPLDEKVCKYQEEKFNLKKDIFYFKCTHYKK